MIGLACADDPQLRARVTELVAAHAKAETFFSECADAVALSAEDFLTPASAEAIAASETTDDAAGSRIGPYKLLQKIGEGGCGAVYMAQQDEPVRRRVALKIIKLGMDTRSVIARFEAERQALAMMEHPGIARVLDAGATETGRPFFVMELVNGVRITEYCDVNKLTTRQRIELFIQVCQAIQHAHQKGIIHRDIKPSNILVTMLDGAALPKVIDFGIAKAIEGRLTEKTNFTAYGHFIGTPAYMSPEQAQMSAMDVDTRGDIYSLGVLLYELLTGKTPFDQKELIASGIDEMRRTLRERDPLRPSTRLNSLSDAELTVTAQQRNLEPQKLRSDLKGDLDWIVMKALEKDRNRRYQTANGLAADVRRYLDNEPVSARPPTRLYRLQKLVRRNKVAFTAGTAVAVALVTGLGFSTRMYFRERDARQRAVHAEQQQLQLRQEAEDRERMTQAAYRISRGEYAEADDYVGKVSSLRPSLEAESVLRTLGEWHLLRNEPALAAKRFTQLLQVDQGNKSEMITTDLLMAGPLQIESGDVQGYEKFRHAAIARFQGTTSPVHAERALKVSLLLPADGAVMKSLEAFARVAGKSLNGDRVNAHITERVSAAWRCASIGLMAYRKDEPSAAKEWCRKSLAFPLDTRARIATARVIMAMACHKLGEVNESRAQLAEGKKLVEVEFAGGIKRGDGWNGFWYDWLFARVLLREAEGLISQPEPAAK